MSLIEKSEYFNLSQSSREEPFLPREWVHRFHKIRITRSKDGMSLDVPCTSANFYLMDLNPIWYVDQLVRTKGNSLFILYLDTTNSCTDRCPMCFTEKTRRNEGFHQTLDVDIALKRIKELRNRYEDTFKMVSLAGPGEPLNLRRINELIAGCNNLGTAVRVYTSGKRLSDPEIRRGLLAETKLVRVSVDATCEETYRKVHGVGGFKERIEGIRKLINERAQRGSETLIGLHFVIQMDNKNEIVKFAEMARDMGADYVVYSQETFGKVRGGFSLDDYNKVVEDLELVEMMHSEVFRTVVPKLVRRQTYVQFDKDYFASPSILNKCHNSKHRIFFGVQNDFSACWLATLDTQFRENSYVGKLADDKIMDPICRVIERGVGDVFNQGAHLSCNSCVASNYNSMVDNIMNFVKEDDDFNTLLLEHIPGQHEDNEYSFKLKLQDEKGLI